jgi:hypothetical protein
MTKQSFPIHRTFPTACQPKGPGAFNRIRNVRRGAYTLKLQFYQRGRKEGNALAAPQFPEGFRAHHSLSQIFGVRGSVLP